MKANKAQIDRFLEQKRIAIAGISRNPKKFGHILYKDLREAGFDIIPINPNMKEIYGVKCYASVNDLPKNLNSLLIATPKQNTDETLRLAIKRGIKNIWINIGSQTKESDSIAKEMNADIIINQCIYMFAEPISGVHKFHKTINKIFGMLPK